MNNSYIKAILALLMLVLSSADYALAQQCYEDWRNEMLSKYPHEDYITGFGECETSEKYWSEKAYDRATVSAAQNISVKADRYTKSESRSDQIITTDSEHEYIHRTDSSFISVSSSAELVFMQKHTKICNGTYHVFVYIKRKDYVNWLQKEIEILLKQINKGIDNATKYYENCNKEKADKTKAELYKKLFPKLRKLKDCLSRTATDSRTNYYTKEINDAGTRCDMAEDNAQKHIKSRINGCAAVASIFVPGAGQWYKGNKFKDNGLIGDGVGFFLGEAVLAGGGLTSYFLSKKQLALMRDPNVSYVDFQKAKKNYKACRITTIVAYSAAAALHIGNIFHAGFKSPKEGYRCVELYPTVISTDTEVVGGVGLTYNF
ncbi:MAG: hypothetical protein K5867_01770 [Bacteroidales bacterium]|nr:hypothetical protein [Bacteroidales bacterium]